jgi:phage portal protein BeeE
MNVPPSAEARVEALLATRRYSREQAERFVAETMRRELDPVHHEYRSRLVEDAQLHRRAGS